MASAGAATLSILARMVDTAPVISSTVSPRTRNAINKAPICDGVASPDIMTSNALAASSRVSAAPVATLPMSALKSCMAGSMRARRSPAVRFVPGCRDIEEVLQDQMTVLGRDALGMELDAVDRKATVRQAHHQAIVGLGSNRKVVGNVVAIDHERMIARRAERPVDAAEYAGAFVLHLGKLAVHRRPGADHVAPERLADRLMAEADPEDRNGWRRLGNEVETDAGLHGRARAGRQHDRVRRRRNDRIHRDLVVAVHASRGPKLTQIVDEVEGETVVVVDEDDHGARTRGCSRS